MGGCTVRWLEEYMAGCEVDRWVTAEGGIGESVDGWRNE